MKSLMTLTGILAFSFSSFATGREYSCPPSVEKQALECSGTVSVTSVAELNSYANDLGLKKGKAKNLTITSSLGLTSDLVISSPCTIKIADDVVLSSTGNICFHGQNGINIGERFKFNGKNLSLESRDEVIVKINSELTGQDIKLLSNGSGDTSKTHIRDGAIINAANLLLESHDKGSIGKNSALTLTGTLGIYALGDDEASIRVGTQVSANKIEISSTEETRVAKNVALNAAEIILNGSVCTIDKTASLTAADKMGNCFLGSIGKAGFTIDKNQGTNPLTVHFNASAVVSEAKGFVWSFGDGETVNTLSPTIFHVYNRVGSFTASLKYATKDNFKGLKNAGFVQIDVKAPVVNQTTTPPRGNFSYAQDGTFVYLKAFIRKTQFDIASAYYVIDDNQNNKIYMTNFYQNSISSVEMNTFGTHKVTMYVEDVQGQKYNATMMIDLKQNEDDIAPVVRFYGEQSAPRTAFINMASSFIPYPDEFLKDFKVEFGDGQVVEVHDAVSVVHTYAAPGTYNVKVTAEFNGNERFAIIPVTVTNDNKPALSPVAAFDYHLFDFAGNVTFNDDRSATPNGEIISYVWNFGDGTQAYGKLVSHFFGPGDHVVSLTVTDTMGLTSTQRQMISIAEPGDDIVSNLSCWKDGDKKIACDVFALDKFDEITRVRVQWGDGTSVNLTGQAEIEEWGLYFAEHVYQSYGTYNLRLTVDTARGQTKYAYASEVFNGQSPVNYPPLASIQCTSNDMLVTCNTFGSYDPEGGVLRYFVNWGNGISGEIFSPTAIHTYDIAGAYNINLTVVDANGLTSQAIITVNVFPSEPPNAAPVAHLMCTTPGPLTISCSGAGSLDTDGYIVSYEINFDNMYIEANAGGVINYRFLTAGEKTITLKVTDNDGSTNTVTSFLIVRENNAPVIESVECYSGKPNKISCYVLATESDEGDLITNYKWDMGDGKEGFDTLIPSVSEYIYSGPGEKIIKLTVSDQYGGQVTVEKTIVVKENKAPVASMNCHSTQNGIYECSANSSYDTDGEIISYSWMVEGVLMTGKNILYTFTDGGQKSIELKVVDDLGMEGIKREEFVVDKPKVNFSCVNSGVLKINCSAQIEEDETIAYYRFEFNDRDFKDGPNVSYDFRQSGLYKVRLVKLSNRLKEGYSEKWINVTGGNLAPKAKFSVGYDFNKVAFFNAVESLSQGRSATRYEWDFGDGETENSTNFKTQHNYSEYGNYQVRLKVIDQGGQSSVFEKIIYVHNPEVEDPGEVGHETILGIDSDSDGIRDDVQRWVNYEAKGEEGIRIILKKLAKNWQENIKEVNDREKSKILIEKRNKIEVCLEGTLADDVRSAHLKQMMEYIYFYREIRFFIREKNRDNYVGVVFEKTYDTNAEKIATCQEI